MALEYRGALETGVMDFPGSSEKARLPRTRSWSNCDSLAKFAMTLTTSLVYGLTKFGWHRKDVQPSRLFFVFSLFVFTTAASIEEGDQRVLGHIQETSFLIHGVVPTPIGPTPKLSC